MKGAKGKGSTAKVTPSVPSPVDAGDGTALRVLLWLVFAASSLFFLPQCVDRSLAPRFLFLSLVLLGGLLLRHRLFDAREERHLHFFEMLLLLWYGINVASVAWAFSWSEAVFYTQKVFLLYVVYRFVYASLRADASGVWRALRQATQALTWVCCGVLSVQLLIGLTQHGFDNERLYQLDWFFFGNKSLSAEFLFFLLIFTILSGDSGTAENRTGKQNALFAVQTGWLLALMLVLQTRTVYLALGAGALIYCALRSWGDAGFALIFRKKIAPIGLAVLLALTGLLAVAGKGSSITERLNPLNYLDSDTANERRFVWYKTDLLNADHFWLGVGNGSWKFWFPSKSIQGAYRLQEQNVIFTRAHNDYLEVRAETGMTGAVLFCSLFVALFAAVFWKIRRGEISPSTSRILATLAAGLAGYGIIQYFDFPRERIEMQVMLAFLFAFTAFYTREIWPRLPEFPAGGKRLVAPLLAAGLVFNLLIGWNRVSGEIHVRKMAQAQAKRDYPRMIAEAQAARSRFFEYNDVAVPFALYEGIGYYQMNQAARAVEALERAWKLNPWNFQVMNNYASALVKSGRYGEAIPIYEKVLEINPKYEDGKFNLSYTEYMAGNIQKALYWLDAVDTIPKPSTETDQQKNAGIRKRQAEFRAVIEASQSTPAGGGR